MKTHESKKRLNSEQPDRFAPRVRVDSEPTLKDEVARFPDPENQRRSDRTTNQPPTRDWRKVVAVSGALASAIAVVYAPSTPIALMSSAVFFAFYWNIDRKRFPARQPQDPAPRPSERSRRAA